MDLSDAAWRKASRSGENGGDCVELAGVGGVVGVRDSKDPDGGYLPLSVAAFAELIEQVKRHPTR